MWTQQHWATLGFWLLALGVCSAQWGEEEDQPTREDREARDYGDYGGGGYYERYYRSNQAPLRRESDPSEWAWPMMKRNTEFGDAMNPLDAEHTKRQVKTPWRRPQSPGYGQRNSGYAAAPQGATSENEVGGGNDVGAGSCGLPIESHRIILGKAAKRGAFPWQAGLLYEKGGERQVFCGGALIHPRFVLTAAHCLNPATTKGWKLVEVRLGLINQRVVDAQARAFLPDKVTLHPQYTNGVVRGVRNNNDIGLIRLPQAAPYTEFIRPICLPSSKQMASSRANVPTVLVTAGWGRTEKGNPSETLLFAPVPLVDSAKCGTTLKVTIPDTQLCAGGTGTDSCQGDSGGPLIQTGMNRNGDAVFEVVGIVSYGPPVCGNDPAGYTKVAPYIGWIKQVISQQG